MEARFFLGLMRRTAPWSQPVPRLSHAYNLHQHLVLVGGLVPKYLCGDVKGPSELPRPATMDVDIGIAVSADEGHGGSLFRKLTEQGFKWSNDPDSNRFMKIINGIEVFIDFITEDPSRAQFGAIPFDLIHVSQLPGINRALAIPHPFRRHRQGQPHRPPRPARRPRARTHKGSARMAQAHRCPSAPCRLRVPLLTRIHPPLRRWEWSHRPSLADGDPQPVERSFRLPSGGNRHPRAPCPVLQDPRDLRQSGQLHRLHRVTLPNAQESVAPPCISWKTAQPGSLLASLCKFWWFWDWRVTSSALPLTTCSAANWKTPAWRQPASAHRKSKP